jgi:hypothetical protein
MNDTLRRMDETQILFNQAVSSLNYPTVFRANLNAFIASARSITWVMKKEFNSKLGFRDWYDKKEAEMYQDEIFKLFKNLRNESVKERPVANKIKFTTNLNLTLGANQEAIIPGFRVGENGDIITQNDESVTINGKPSPETKHQTRHAYFFDQRPNDDALDLSRSYLDKLSNMITECYNIFS